MIPGNGQFATSRGRILGARPAKLVRRDQWRQFYEAYRILADVGVQQHRPGTEQQAIVSNDLMVDIAMGFKRNKLDILCKSAGWYWETRVLTVQIKCVCVHFSKLEMGPYPIAEDFWSGKRVPSCGSSATERS